MGPATKHNNSTVYSQNENNAEHLSSSMTAGAVSGGDVPDTDCTTVFAKLGRGAAMQRSSLFFFTEKRRHACFHLGFERDLKASGECSTNDT